jgi:hypothetical protein
MRRRTSGPVVPNDLNTKEDGMSQTGAKMAEKADSPTSNHSETVKMTLYISKPVAKEFKKLAIDEEKDYSELATLALSQFMQNRQQT